MEIKNNACVRGEKTVLLERCCPQETEENADAMFAHLLMGARHNAYVSNARG